MSFVFSLLLSVSIQFCHSQWPKEIIIPSAPNYIGLSAPSSLEIAWLYAQSYCEFHYGTSLARILTISDQAEIEALVTQMNVNNGGGEDGSQAYIGYTTADSSTENIAWAPCSRTIHEECTYDPCEANTDYWATWHQQEGAFEKNRCGCVKRGNEGTTLGKWVFDTCGEKRDFICNSPNGKYSNDIHCFPTQSPTFIPTLSPTNIPTTKPTESPLAPDSPTKAPSQPTVNPTKVPSINPTIFPSLPPTTKPTNYPSQPPTNIPSMIPTTQPTNIPSVSPTKQPTINPTKEGQVNEILTTESRNDGLSDMNNSEPQDTSKLMLIIYILSGLVILLILAVLMLLLLLRKAKTKLINVSNVQAMDVTHGYDSQNANIGSTTGETDTKPTTETKIFQQIQMQSVNNVKPELSSSDSESLFDVNDKINETKGVNDVTTQGQNNDSDDAQNDDMYIKNAKKTKL